MARVEVITGPERRRRWTEEQKRAIVAESFAPRAVVSEVARRADVRASQIYRWRRELGVVADGFAQVMIAPSEPAAVQGADGGVCGALAIEIEFVGRTRVRIPTGIPAELAAAVVRALARR
jgi:transposase